MFREFNDFYGLDKERYKNLWDNCIFIFDANVLLNLYRYSDSTRDELLKIIQHFKDRAWLPYQVGLEFHFNRSSVIQSQADSYESISKSIEKKSSTVKKELNDELKEYKKRHPRIDIEKTLEKLEKSIQALIKDIKELETDHPDYIGDNDDILQQLTLIFDGKVGEIYDQKKLDDISTEGEKRYKLEIPPGYEDLKAKKGKKKFYDGLYISSEYGDLIVWNQIIDLASAHQKPVIFVTDDVKKDWWEIVRGRTLGPRVELINEFRIKTNELFYMYKTDRFMDFAKDYLHQEINPEAIQEVKDYREARKKSNDPEKLYEVLYKDVFPYLNADDWDEFEDKFLSVGVPEKEVMKWAQNKNHLRKIESDNLQAEYNVGDYVKHGKWGVGEVLGSTMKGEYEEIDVKFESGIKRLLAKFAPINKIIL